MIAPLLAGGLTEPPKGDPHPMDQKAGEDGLTQTSSEGNSKRDETKAEGSKVINEI